MTVKHKKTGQELKKIDRSKRKPKKSAAAAHGIDTKGMPVKDAKAVEKAAESLPVPKPRQPALPGVEEPHYAELAGYADELQVAKESAKSAGDLVKRKEAALIAAMKKRKRTEYVDRGRNIYIVLTTTEHAKVKQFNHEDEDKLV